MSRARNIKPGFYRDAALVELPIETRLLFPGLWMLADRAGRLEDKPKQIKMEIYPADNFDVNSLLQQLNDAGLVIRYEANGIKYIQIKNFDKHQNPHRDEKASTIPAPTEHCANTVQAPCKHDGNRADSLIPDSLIPDSNTSVAKATGDKSPMTADEIIFSYGVPLLTNAGSTDKAARSFLGGLRKTHGDDAVVNTLRDCLRAKPLQPLQWLAAALPPGGRGGGKQSALEARNAAVVAAWVPPEMREENVYEQV